MFLFLAPRSLTWWTQDQSQVSKVDNDTHPSTEFRKSLRPWNLDANVTGVAWPCCHSRLLHGIQTFLSCSKDELQGFASFDILHSNVQALHGLFLLDLWDFLCNFPVSKAELNMTHMLRAHAPMLCEAVRIPSTSCHIRAMTAGAPSSVKDSRSHSNMWFVPMGTAQGVCTRTTLSCGKVTCTLPPLAKGVTYRIYWLDKALKVGWVPKGRCGMMWGKRCLKDSETHHQLITNVQRFCPVC